MQKEKRMKKLLIFLCTAAIITIFSGVASALVVSDFIDSPYSTSYAPTYSVYDTATIDVYIDPASTNWLALSIVNDLRTNLPNLSGIPTIQSTQMDDAIYLTAAFGNNISTRILLDDNDSQNRRIGNQAVFYGYFDSVGSFNGFTTSTYGAQAETGALTSFFDTYGAGTYTLTLQYYNKYSGTAGHSNVYLLRDIDDAPAPDPVPEPATLILFGIGMMGIPAFRRKRS